MYIYENKLYHHGVKGMHWGVRRYQNADGSYTSAGKKRNLSKAKKLSGKLEKAAYAQERMHKSTKSLGVAKTGYGDGLQEIQILNRKDHNNYLKSLKKADKYGQKLTKKGYDSTYTAKLQGRGKKYVEAIVNGESSRIYLK